MSCSPVYVYIHVCIIIFYFSKVGITDERGPGLGYTIDDSTV